MIMLIGFKIRLYPDEDTKIILKLYFEASIVVYNLGVDMCINASTDYNNRECLNYQNMGVILTQLINTEEYYWLKSINRVSLNMALKDLSLANNQYIRGYCPPPGYRIVDYTHRQTGMRGERLQIYKDRISVSSTRTLPIPDIKCNNPYDFLIGNSDIRTHKDMPFRNYQNVRIQQIYDEYYLSVSLELDISQGIYPNSLNRFLLNDEWRNKLKTDVVGLDLGCKGSNWIVASNGMTLSMPDTSKEQKKCDKYKKQLDRKIDNNNKKLIAEGKDISHREYTNNEKKLLKKYHDSCKRIHDIKENAIHNFVCEILDTKPKAIVMESLCVDDMVIRDNSIPRENREAYNQKIYNSMLYSVIEIVKEKAEVNNILFIPADPHFPSSQLCSNCGNRINIGRSRLYCCPICGMVMDRDQNASLNLRNYGRDYIEKHKKPFVTFA